MERRNLTVPARLTVVVAALAVGSSFALAETGGHAVAATGHHAVRAVGSTGGTNSQLEGVTVVPSSTDAWAIVGTVVNSPYSNTYSVARRHDNRWRKVAVKTTPGNTTVLRGIAAGSAKLLWLVGNTEDGDVDTALLERSTGKAFKPVQVKGLTTGEHLSTVAASGPSNAWALGGKDDGTASVALHWNGKKWASRPISVGGTVFFPYAVSTSSTRDAWAIGSNGTVGEIIHWNGKKWALSELEPSGQELEDIVTTGAHVWAVGSLDSTSGTTPLAVRLTTSGWKTVHIKHSTAAIFQAVTAIGATAYAVGRTVQTVTPNATAIASGGTIQPIFARLHGAKGTYAAIKKKGKYSVAVDVAASTKAVIAVGTYATGGVCATPDHPLAEQLVHDKWKLQAIPNKVARATKTGTGPCL